MPILGPGEEVVLSEAGKYAGKDGVLSLTTRRLVFESRSGLLSKKSYTNVDVPIDGIVNVMVEGLLSKKLYVALKQGFTPPRCEFSVSDPAKWQQNILQAIRQR